MEVLQRHLGHVMIIGERYVFYSVIISQRVLMYFQLKKDFAVVKQLREQSGFGWDNALKIVTAPPDVWDKYLEVCLTNVLLNL